MGTAASLALPEVGRLQMPPMTQAGVDAPSIVVHDRSKMSPLEQMRTQPSKFFSIAQQCAILAGQLRMPSGAPLIKIVEAAEEKLGLDGQNMRLFERCAMCYDAIYATERPQPADPP